jgi:hypothetical protein
MSPVPRPSPQDTSEALPFLILSRLSRINQRAQRRAPPCGEPLAGGAPAGAAPKGPAVVSASCRLPHQEGLAVLESSGGLSERVLVCRYLGGRQRRAGPGAGGVGTAGGESLLVTGKEKCALFCLLAGAGECP